MNIKRFLTGIVGFPIVMLFLIFGNKYMVDIAFAIIAIIAMSEYIKCVSPKVKVVQWISYFCAALVGVIPLIPVQYLTILMQLGIPTILFILFLHVIISNMKISFEDIAYTLIGILYIFGLLVFVPIIYGHEGIIAGKILIWFVMFSAWGTDLFAYVVGKRIGKTKFSKVSPNKSIEGCIAGTVGAIVLNLIFTFILNQYFGYDIPFIKIGLITLVLSLIGQVGDFSASVIKRSFDIKDFSELFPGHGGMLDRIDSIMFIVPFAYFLLTTCL